MESKYKDPKRNEEAEFVKLIGILDRRVVELEGLIEDKEKEHAIKTAILTIRGEIIKTMLREV